jgi:hypothetical protein
VPLLDQSLRGAALAVAAGLVLGGCGMTVTTDREAVSRASVQRTGSATTPLGSPDPGKVGGPAPRAASGPAAPVPSAAVRPGVFALGDSVMLGAEPALATQRYRVDAKVGRQFYEGILALRAVNRTGTLPRNVVVHLGTNGTITSKHCDAMVATAGAARRLFFVTVFGPRSWMRGNDVVLRACAARHRTDVILVDWATAAAHHPAWLGHDRIHPNTLGHKAYTALIESAVRRYQI